MKLSFSRIFLFSFFIYMASFLFIYIFNINNLILQSEDLVTTSAIPFSILKEGNVNLSEYYNLFVESYPNPDTKGDTPYYLKNIGGAYYSAFPLLTSLVVLPLYVIPTLLNFSVTVDLLAIMSRLGGAFVSALSVATFYLVLKEFLKEQELTLENYSLNKFQILLFLVIYAFGTNMYSLNSQGLWQHGTSTLLLSIATYFLLRRKEGISGLFFGLATIARPTNLLAVVIFGLLILVKNKTNLKRVINYLFLLMIPIIIELVVTFVIFGSLFNTGYGSQTGGWTSNWIEGILGTWSSPSKGILVISPVFIFIFYAIYKSFRNIKKLSLELFISLIVLLHTLVLAKWHHWYGGYSWGYRMSSDIIPYLVLLLVPFASSKYFKSRFLKVTFYIFTIWSVFIQLLGIIVFDGTWHLLYDKGAKSTDWLWSVKNNQIWFSIKRVLHKIGLLI